MAKITEEGLSGLMKFLNVELPIKNPFNEYATKDNIRHYAIAIGDMNPLWCDEEYAKKTRYGGIIAPPMFIITMEGLRRPWGLPGVHSLNAGTEQFWHLPIRLNDRITGTTRLSGMTEKKSQWGGRSFVQEWTLTFKNQNGEVVLVEKGWSIRGERNASRDKGKYSQVKVKTYTDDEMAAIEAEYEKEIIRGAEPRYWEDVNVGDELTPIIKGPTVLTDMVAFKIGFGFDPFCYPNEYAVAYRKRHPGATTKNSLGIPDVPERVHWESNMAQEIGIPAAYDYGPQRGSWLCQLITNWMGDDGWLKKFYFEVRRPNIIGDLIRCKGNITRKYVEDNEHRVDIECGAENQRGENTAPGRATVVLPIKK